MAIPFQPVDPSRAAHTERSHAARNRRRVLDAAGRLFSERCPSEVTMDEVARAAGVGKGTVYRRFGDRSGLALAVLDARERQLQGMILRGPPPLGPGAPPGERLRAFLEALLDQLALDGDLHALADAEGARYRSRAYQALHLHAVVLLRELLPDRDPALLADLVLAPIRADLYGHLNRERGMGIERLRAGVGTIVDALLALSDHPSA